MSLQSVSSWQECHQCGRLFITPRELMKHGRSCKRGKKCLTKALAKAKELYYRKKPRLARNNDLEEIGDFVPMDSQHDNGTEATSCSACEPSSGQVVEDAQGTGGDSAQVMVRMLLVH